MDRQYDIILWGATGYTGKLIAGLFAKRYGFGKKGHRIALAGRSAARLAAVADMMVNEALQSTDPEIRQEAADIRTHGGSPVPVIELIKWGDTRAETDILAKDLCSLTYVIIATAGPFVECGEPIIKAAAETGTDYVDITGEIAWVKEMHQKYNFIAQKNKARILPCCGFDYIPNDIGVYCLQRIAKDKSAPPVKVIDQLVDVCGSKASGGTLRTGMNMMSQMPLTVFLKGSDPYAFCEKKPENEEIVKQNKDLSMVRYSPLAQTWMAPNVMGQGMKRYIHWINDIQNHIYGEDFIYQAGSSSNGLLTGFGKSVMTNAALCSLFVASKIPSCGNRLAPQAGEGLPLSEISKPGANVFVRTVGVVHPSNGDPICINHTIKFDKGEAYLLTAYTALCSAMCCLKTRRREGAADKFGIGPPSALLGDNLLDEMKLFGFEFGLKETDAVSD